jgi:hypothetical protein
MTTTTFVVRAADGFPAKTLQVTPPPLKIIQKGKRGEGEPSFTSIIHHLTSQS